MRAKDLVAEGFVAEGFVAEGFVAEGFVAGDLVAGRYQLDERLPERGDEVWRATELATGATVMLRGIALDPNTADAATGRLVDHARLIRRLRHPDAVPVCDVMVEAERGWLVTEYSSAYPVSARVWRHGPLSTLDTARIGAGTAAVLAAAHAAGIGWGPVRPETVLVDAVDGRIRLDPAPRAGGARRPADDVADLGTTLRAISADADPAGDLARALDAMVDADPAERPTAVEAVAVLGTIAGLDRQASVAPASRRQR